MGMYSDAEEATKKMIGRRLTSVSLEDNRETVVFRLEGGDEFRFGVDGDCCSHSWIEHLEVPNDVAGALLVSVEDVGLGDIDGGSEHDCLQAYQTKFKTDRGEIALEYRNSSNGYYGGYLVAK